MIEVTRAVEHLGMAPVFQVHDSGYNHLVDEAGFRRLPGARHSGRNTLNATP